MFVSVSYDYSIKLVVIYKQYGFDSDIVLIQNKHKKAYNIIFVALCIPYFTHGDFSHENIITYL